MIDSYQLIIDLNLHWLHLKRNNFLVDHKLSLKQIESAQYVHNKLQFPIDVFCLGSSSIKMNLISDFFYKLGERTKLTGGISPKILWHQVSIYTRVKEPRYISTRYGG